MTPTELSTAISTLGHSVKGFAEYIGVSETTVHNWRSGRQDVPVLVARYVELRLKDVHSITLPQDLAEELASVIARQKGRI